MFDRPWWRDWLFWLTLTGVAIALSRVSIEGTVLTFLLDIVIEVGIALVLFWFAPRLVRDEWRSRHKGP